MATIVSAIAVVAARPRHAAHVSVTSHGARAAVVPTRPLLTDCTPTSAAEGTTPPAPRSHVFADPRRGTSGPVARVDTSPAPSVLHDGNVQGALGANLQIAGQDAQHAQGQAGQAGIAWELADGSSANTPATSPARR